jgi:hypothetical protein
MLAIAMRLNRLMRVLPLANLQSERVVFLEAESGAAEIRQLESTSQPGQNPALSIAN